MTDDQAERLIDVLVRMHVSLDALRRELSSQLGDIVIASSHVGGR